MNVFVHTHAAPTCLCPPMPRHAGGGRRRPDDQLQRGMRGHVVAVPQATPEEWRRVFPCAPDRLPDVIRVILVGSARTDAEVRTLASRARALQVRGTAIEPKRRRKP
jgi:hypothetical protein